MRSSFIRYVRRAVVVSAVLGAISLLLFAFSQAYAAEVWGSKPLVIRDREWTLVVRTDDSSMEANPYLPAPPEARTIADDFAFFLKRQGIDPKHPAIVLGHAIGGGLYLYGGHVDSVPRGARYGWDAHSRRGITGVELVWRMRF